MIVCLGLFCASISAWAAESDSGYGFSASVGTAARDQNHDDWRIGAQRHWARRWWETERWHFTGYWDLSFARFDASDLPVRSTIDRGPAKLWAVALAPVVRWQFQSLGSTQIAPFVELAVGLSYLSDSRLRTGKIRSLALGSHFQFEDRAVIGVRIGRHWELAYQRMHYSNLNQADDNHGLDTHLGMLSWRF